MKHTAVLELSGALSGAVAVEWTDLEISGGDVWEPCIRLADGRWRLSSRDAAAQVHWRGPGNFLNIGIRYRLTADGPWSPVSADRKDVFLSAAPAETDPLPAPVASDWPKLMVLELGEDVFTGTFVLSGLAAAAVQVEWTEADEPGEDDWTACLALGEGQWHLGGDGFEPGTLSAGIRYRLAADGPWSPVSADRKSVTIPDPNAGNTVLPILLAAPVLSGTGRIGEPVSAEPGNWGGVPAPELSLQWCRDGRDISGATGAQYVPGPKDDLTDLTCRVTASNIVGSIGAETDALRVTYAPPVVAGSLPEEVFDEDTGPQDVDAAAVFEGENLSYSVSGAGAVINAATGLVSIPTSKATDGETVTVTATNSGGSAQTGFVVTVEKEEEEPGGGGGEEAYIRAPWHTEAKRAANYPPSDNLQVVLCYSRSPVNSDVIYAGQDVGAFWVSRDSGRSWNTLRNRGLGTVNAVSVACCPVDEDHVLSVMGSRAKNGDCGIYRSLDKGITWSRVLAWPSFGEPRTAMQRLAYAPSTAKGGRDQVRWYAVFDTAAGFSSSPEVGTPGLLTSTDGGRTWKEIRNLPAATFGEDIYGARVDPLDEEVLYFWSEAGLFRINNASGNGSDWEQISGLPGSKIRDLYISEDGRTLICAVPGNGVWKSTNRGTAWTRLLSWGGVTHCAVNEGYPDRMYAYKRGTSPREQVRYTTDGGNTWRTDARVENFPGSGNAAIMGGSEPYILPDPSNPNRATGFADAKWFQTDNGGRNWDLRANAYYCGTHHKGWASPHSFHPTDPKIYMLGMLDAYPMLTTNGGVTLTQRRTNGLGLVHSSVNGIAMHPDGRHVIASVSLANKGALVWSDDLGATWSVAESAMKHRAYLGFDAGNPDYAYQWRQRSVNTGRTWSSLQMPDGDAVILGVSRTAHNGASIIYAVNTGGNAQKIWKSADRGNSWSQVVNAGYDLTAPGDARTTFRIHPANPHVIFTRGPVAGNGSSQIRRWDTQGTLRQTDFDVFNGGAVEPGFYADNFAIDAYNPDVMYLRSRSFGTGNYLFMTEDGGKTWSNISAGFPNCTGGNGLEVHPLTGVLYIGTANGMYVRKPPYPVPTSDNTYDLLREAYPEWRNSHLETKF